MHNEDTVSEWLETLDAYEKSRLRDAWVLAAIAWAAWVAVAIPGLASDMTSGVFMGLSIAALARALQVQLRRSPGDKLIAALRDRAAQRSGSS